MSDNIQTNTTGRYHAPAGGRHRERRQRADARLFHPMSQMYRQCDPQRGGDVASGGVQIAVKTVTDFLREHGDAVDRVICNVFKDSDREIYEEIFRSLSL